MMLNGKRDKTIAGKQNNPTKNATYLSKYIRNELIITMGVTSLEKYRHNQEVGIVAKLPNLL